MDDLRSLLSTQNTELGDLCERTVTHLNKVRRQHNSGTTSVHLITVNVPQARLGENGWSSQHNQATFTVTAEKFEDGADGLFGAFSKQLSYGEKKFFNTNNDAEAIQELRNQAADGYGRISNLASSFYLLQGYPTDVNSFEKSLRKPLQFSKSSDIIALIAEVCGFKIPVDIFPGLIILEKSVSDASLGRSIPKHIAVLAGEWNIAKKRYEYYSVISVKKNP